MQESEDEHAHEEESDHDHDDTSGTEAAAASEITEVTGCHAHGADSLFCSAGGEEWEVTTDVDVDNAPESYSGCHSHGEDEL